MFDLFNPDLFGTPDNENPVDFGGEGGAERKYLAIAVLVAGIRPGIGPFPSAPPESGLGCRLSIGTKAHRQIEGRAQLPEMAPLTFLTVEIDVCAVEFNLQGTLKDRLTESRQGHRRIRLERRGIIVL